MAEVDAVANATDGRKLFIGNITYNTGDRELNELFGKYGRVEEVRVAVDRVTGRSRGYGFVTMENADDAAEALKNVTGMTVDGREVRVEIAGGGGGRREGGERRRDDRGGDRDRGDYRGGRGDDRGGRDYGRDRDYGGGRGRDYGRDGGRDRDYGRERDYGGARRDRDRSRDRERSRDRGGRERRDSR